MQDLCKSLHDCGKLGLIRRGPDACYVATHVATHVVTSLIMLPAVGTSHLGLQRVGQVAELPERSG